MKTIIAGSRNVHDPTIVAEAVRQSGFMVTEVVSGTARGVDTLGEHWADRQHIPVKKFPASWDKYGKAAGYRRNEQMAGYAEALIAVWDGFSRGTGHMIDIAKRKGLKVFIHYTKTVN